MSNTLHDPFNARTLLPGVAGETYYYRLGALEEAGIGHVSRLPFSIKVLLEALLRQVDGFAVTEEDVAGWPTGTRQPGARSSCRSSRPASSCRTSPACPGVVDLAAMRSAMARLGGDPKRVNPLIPVDLVIDHSVQVDQFGSQPRCSTTPSASSSATASATSS